jgi:hypothetical protein
MFMRWCVLGLFFPAIASARVGSMPFDHLVVYSEFIVLAKVTELLPASGSDNDVVFATASVQRTFKGSLSGSFLLRASPGVICDSSMAIKDETALFFLNRGDDGIYYIQFAGRGRMPLRQVDGKTYVSLWREVVLPEDAPAIAGPDAQYSFISSVELPYLEALIRKYRDRKPVYSKPEDIISGAAG